MVEGTGLENRHTWEGIGGSNPSSSDSLNMLNFKDIKILRRLTFEISDTKEIYQFTNPQPSMKAYDLISIIPKNEKIFEMVCNDLNVDLIQLAINTKSLYISKDLFCLKCKRKATRLSGF